MDAWLLALFLVITAGITLTVFYWILRCHREEMRKDREVSAELWHGYIELKMRLQQQLLERLWSHDQKLDKLLERSSGPCVGTDFPESH